MKGIIPFIKKKKAQLGITTPARAIKVSLDDTDTQLFRLDPPRSSNAQAPTLLTSVSET